MQGAICIGLLMLVYVHICLEKGASWIIYLCDLHIWFLTIRRKNRTDTHGCGCLRWNLELCIFYELIFIFFQKSLHAMKFNLLIGSLASQLSTRLSIPTTCTLRPLRTSQPPPKCTPAADTWQCLAPVDTTTIITTIMERTRSATDLRRSESDAIGRFSLRNSWRSWRRRSVLLTIRTLCLGRLLPCRWTWRRNALR